MTKFIVVDEEAYCLDSRGITHCYLPESSVRLFWDEDNLRVVKQPKDASEAITRPYRYITRDDYLLYTSLYQRLQMQVGIVNQLKQRVRQLSREREEIE